MTRSDRVRTSVSAGIRPLLSIAIRATWIAGACLFPAAASAQYGANYDAPRPSSDQNALATHDWSDEVPAHVSVVNGDVQLERDGSVEALDENMPLLAGDRIRTDRGRVEVLFADGSVLDLDEYTDVAFLADDLLRMVDGRLRLLIARSEKETAYRVDAAGTIAWLQTAGEYRVDIDDRGSRDPEVHLGVLRGAAELQSPLGRTALRAGDETASTSRTTPLLPYATIASSRDAFDLWIEQQYNDRAGARSISAQYLPADLRYYGSAFDQDGSWLYEPRHGYVWYPRVPVTWLPYADGRWTFAGAFGWTWVGTGRSTWATHHYGRWGNTSGRWYWIPDCRWAPAWVSWGGSTDYVGWCPLGYDNRPVASIAGLTVYSTNQNRGWTVVPARAFGPGFAVRSHALNTRTLPANERFASRGNGPARPSSARADIQPVRGPSLSSRSYAVPRDNSASRPPSSTGPRPAPSSPSLPPSRTIPPNDWPSPSARPDPPSRRVEPRRDPEPPREPAQAPRNRGGAESAPPDRSSGGSRSAPPDASDCGRAQGRDRR